MNQYRVDMSHTIAYADTNFFPQNLRQIHVADFLLVVRVLFRMHLFLLETRWGGGKGHTVSKAHAESKRNNEKNIIENEVIDGVVHDILHLVYMKQQQQKS